MENILVGSIIGLVSLVFIFFIYKIKSKKSKSKIDLQENNIDSPEVQLQKKGGNKLTSKKGGIFDQKTNPMIREKAANWTTSESYDEDINKLNIDEILDNKIKPTETTYTKDNNVKDKIEFKTQILLVDDSLVVRKYVGDLLKKNRYDIVLKNDGWDAITYLNGTTQKPDLIISDIEMPNMNGFQLIEAIRKEKKYESVPILVISAHAENHLKLMETETIQGFIKKPFEDSDLIIQIRYLLEE